MSRMFLYLDKSRQPSGNITETYPIYELDYEAAVAAGCNIELIWDTKCTNSVNDCWCIVISSTDTNVNRYFSTNSPHQAWQEGSILKGRMSPYIKNEETGIYDLDPTYYNFEPIPVGTRPNDWGTASNIVSYFMPPAFTYNSVSYRYKLWFNNRKDYTWDASKQYYYDKNRAIIKQFYTENGYSFGCYCGGDDYSSSGSNNSPYCNLIGYSQGTDSIGIPNANRYPFSNPSGERLRFSNGRSDAALNCSAVSLSSNEEKANCLIGNDIRRSWTQVFFHTKYAGKDYYGVLGYRCSSFAEDAPIVSWYGMAYTDEMWGDSIIAGGGGESVWGNDGPTSVPQGGNGSWDWPSNNRGDFDGTDVSNRATTWNSSNNAFNSGFNKYILSDNAQSDIQAFNQMIGKLWNPSIWESFNNKLMNPIDSIITCHTMPTTLVHRITGNEQTAKIHCCGSPGVDLSDTQVALFDDFYKFQHVGNITLDDGTDSFADFTNCAFYINLPYIGMKQLDVASCQGGQLSVDYVGDALTGDCIAFITVQDRFGNKAMRYEFKGNCARPVYLKQRVSAATSLISAAAPTIIAAGATMGIGAVANGIGNAASYATEFAHELTARQILKDIPGMFAAGAAKGLSQAATNLIEQGGVAAAAGALGNATGLALNAGQATLANNASGGSVSTPINTACYLIIERPMWSAPENYRKLFGYPSDIGGIIEENFEGFLIVRSIILDNINGATDTEKAEIISLMRNGVYVSDDFGPED